jgi:hypothetical protein
MAGLKFGDPGGLVISDLLCEIQPMKKAVATAFLLDVKTRNRHAAHTFELCAIEEKV